MIHLTIIGCFIDIGHYSKQLKQVAQDHMVINSVGDMWGLGA